MALAWYDFVDDCTKWQTGLDPHSVSLYGSESLPFSERVLAIVSIFYLSLPNMVTFPKIIPRYHSVPDWHANQQDNPHQIHHTQRTPQSLSGIPAKEDYQTARQGWLEIPSKGRNKKEDTKHAEECFLKASTSLPDPLKLTSPPYL